jgi:ubiquinone/menaquinone biosynthesis C-methylase UbiE
MNNISNHFSTIAQKYRVLRTTDFEPILYIKEQLKELHKIEAADFGCGTGRYDFKLFQYLGDKLFLYCIDSNNEMLEQLETYLIQHRIKNCQIMKNNPEKYFTFQDKFLDCIFIFNVIHLINIYTFLNEASRVLKDRGYLFIYTRLRSQNMQSIWGRYFPLFSQKETRLYELEELKNIISEIPSLEIQNIKYFKYQRVSCLCRLVDQAINHHYSTFHYYDSGEFEKSLNTFKQHLKYHFDDINKISWIDRNVLLLIKRKCTS